MNICHLNTRGYEISYFQTSIIIWGNFVINYQKKQDAKLYGIEVIL